MKKLTAMAAALSCAFALTACGGGGHSGAPEQTQVVTSDATLAITPTTGATTTAAVQGVDFTFASGVPALSTTGATTLEFTAPPTGTTTPSFSVADTTGTATGVVEFGSCIFVVQASTIPSLPVGTRRTVSPCAINVDSSGLPADSEARTRSIALVLGAAASSGTSATVAVNEGGQLTLNATSVGTVTVAPVTGS
jgi:hypothetical protein